MLYMLCKRNFRNRDSKLKVYLFCNLRNNFLHNKLPNKYYSNRDKYYSNSNTTHKCINLSLSGYVSVYNFELGDNRKSWGMKGIQANETLSHC